MAFSFDNLLVECGTENMAGLNTKVLVIPHCAMKTRPSLPSSGTSDSDYVTAAGAYTFKDATSQHPIYLAVSKDQQGYSAESQGEVIGSKSFHQKGEFFYALDTIRASAFARQIHNQLCDVIFERPDGTQVVMFDCEIKPAVDLGKKPSDKSGYTFTAEADHFAPRIFMGTPIDMDAIADETTGTTTQTTTTP